MYKCLLLPSRTELIILSPEWKGRLPELRQLDEGNLLVCQGCLQPVRVKAGRVRRRHFAHKHLKGCSFGSESPEILAARAVLYGWLLERFSAPEYAVTLEQQLPLAGLPRPVDGWVEGPGGPFAWWMIDKGLHLEARQKILQAFEGLKVVVHWVLLADMLHLDPHRPKYILLSPTERALLQSSEFDEIGWRERLAGTTTGQTLHYLDVLGEALVTYRSLELVHRPNVFSGLRVEDALAQVEAAARTGEFVHPGENARLRNSRRSRVQHEQELQAAEERFHAWFAPRPVAGPVLNKISEESAQAPDRVSLRSEQAIAYACLHCGQLTSNYWMTTVVDGVRRCKCRECLERGLA